MAQTRSCEHAMLVELYAAYGGLADGDAVALQMRRLHSQPLSLLGRWIADRELVSCVWRGTVLLPVFQMDAGTWLPRPGVRRAVRELRDAYDDVELALWFARPHPIVRGRAPAAALDAEPDLVVEAARADRFLARW